MRKLVMTILLFSVLLIFPLLLVGCGDDDPNITLDSCQLDESCRLQ
jgi:hypothetical protein